ncbi:MAG: NAD(P)/FAD-dependent oxidoreductase [Clostridiales bacterium]|jgi:thioredoxin reductase (NADPH)|nr:NAD(P)/FAD-dependent oxidoreductase [Clostridiales bacterium]
MTDVAIIGSGPAGLSAAVNARARGASAVVYGRDPATSALYRAPALLNHLGAGGRPGGELLREYIAEAEAAGVAFERGRVSQIITGGVSFGIIMGSEFFQAKTVVIASGGGAAKTVPGEERFVGKGVSYCATCDGALYRGRDVAIVAETDEAREDAELLARMCRRVYYVDKIGKGLPGERSNVEFVPGDVSGVSGGEYVEKVEVGSSQIAVDAVFFIRPVVPVSGFIFGLAVDPSGAIAVGRSMETSIPGVFACGDAAGKPYQLSKAIGEGLVAGQSAARYNSV